MLHTEFSNEFNDGSVERVIEPVTSFLEALLGMGGEEKRKLYLRFRNDMSSPTIFRGCNLFYN